jgi:hypothetical protein
VGWNPKALPRKIAAEMAAARAEFIEMQRALDEIVRDTPEGLPLSDGQVLLMQSSSRLTGAFEKYEDALQKYYDFVVRKPIARNAKNRPRG